LKKKRNRDTGYEYGTILAGLSERQSCRCRGSIFDAVVALVSHSKKDTLYDGSETRKCSLWDEKTAARNDTTCNSLIVRAEALIILWAVDKDDKQMKI
jgi:hypothetical protein